MRRDGRLEADSCEIGFRQAEAVQAAAGAFDSLTTVGLRELVHDSGRRLKWMPWHEIGWDDRASGIRCFDGDEVVATVNMSADPSRVRAAFIWLMTGGWV